MGNFPLASAPSYCHQAVDQLQDMWSIAVAVLVVTGSVSCNTSCPDGKVCPDQSSSDVTALDSSVSVVWCDSRTFCPDSTTCCRLPSGLWGCCPHPHAVCCWHGLHCCPLGTRCTYPYLGCVGADGLRFPFIPKQDFPVIESPKISKPENEVTDEIKETAEEVRVPSLILLQSDVIPLQGEDNTLDTSVSVVRCDFRSSCPDGTTCCRSPSGRWSCCPYPKGVCCSDRLHCCPKGTSCTYPYRGCLKADGLRFPFIPKQDFPAIKAAMISKPENEVTDEIKETAEEVRVPSLILLQSDVIPLQGEDNTLDTSVSVVRCDSRSSCPDGTTCCRSPSGRWSCCPYPLAVCCSDSRTFLPSKPPGSPSDVTNEVSWTLRSH
ncbi:hypothetical protein DPEC_G00319000 [Dallia pectoralis]|uniref:Uncharacterized protein n=1 Tax=Dallia pectoralis TaxID=75939 RepID=A0ACC2F9P0_DALPE|nr:hypothetical protein DPEC_G00319000 [Dallia pectoralis]